MTENTSFSQGLNPKPDTSHILSESKTNEDFNKKKPLPNDPDLDPDNYVDPLPEENYDIESVEINKNNSLGFPITEHPSSLLPINGPDNEDEEDEEDEDDINEDEDITEDEDDDKNRQASGDVTNVELRSN